MKFQIDYKEIIESDLLINSGKQANIYKIDNNSTSAIKLYRKSFLKSMTHRFYRKIFILHSLQIRNKNESFFKYCAFPTSLIFDLENPNQLIGFTMNYFSNSIELVRAQYDINRKQYKIPTSDGVAYRLVLKL